ncbi:hypothetical protein, partial [Stenotrophomonas pavanii]|uniref:hypothetical protein n=1 Tax=Stenotrophomonas pavanii TaxID=487698 RepID=UPI0039C6A73D
MRTLSQRERWQDWLRVFDPDRHSADAISPDVLKRTRLDVDRLWHGSGLGYRLGRQRNEVNV